MDSPYKRNAELTRYAFYINHYSEEYISTNYLSCLIVGRGIRSVVSRGHVIQGAEHVQDDGVNNMRSNLRLVKQRRNDPENGRHYLNIKYLVATVVWT